MTYFGATDELEDGVESKLATWNYFPYFHRNVPREHYELTFHVEHCAFSKANWCWGECKSLETGICPSVGVSKNLDRPVFHVEH